MASAFVAARRAARRWPAIPANPPARPACRLSHPGPRHCDRWPHGRAGWKVGRINARPMTRLWAANRLAGRSSPMKSCSPSQGRAMSRKCPSSSGGFAAAEAEMLLHVAPGWNGAIPAGRRRDPRRAGRCAAGHRDCQFAVSPASMPMVRLSPHPISATMPWSGHRPRARRLAKARSLRDSGRMEIDWRGGRREATAATMLDGPYRRGAFPAGQPDHARGIDAGRRAVGFHRRDHRSSQAWHPAQVTAQPSAATARCNAGFHCGTGAIST